MPHHWTDINDLVNRNKEYKFTTVSAALKPISQVKISRQATPKHNISKTTDKTSLQIQTEITKTQLQVRLLNWFYIKTGNRFLETGL